MGDNNHEASPSNLSSWAAHASIDNKAPLPAINSDIDSIWLTQAGYSIFDAQIAYENADGKTDLVFRIKNITDKQYLFGGDADAAAGFAQGNDSPPRTDGVTLRRRF